MQLREYQQKAIADIREAFRTTRRVLLTMPCGAGKTILFTYMAHGVQSKGKRVLIQVHRKELLRQVSQALDSWGVRHAILNADNKGTPRANVVVASTFTLINRLKHFPEPHLIVTDEAHHAAGGNTWNKILAHFPNAMSLGVTATPARTSGHGLRECFDRLVLGPSVAELQAMGYLCPVEVYASKDTLDLRGLRTRGGDYVASDLEAAMDKPTLTGSAVDHYRRICDGKRAVAFCCSVKHAVDVATQFREAGYRAEHVDGGMEDFARDAALYRFSKGETQVLTSADLISEGWDVPGIEVVIGLRPTKSLILYVQQLGRGQRPAHGKDRCIYIDHAANTSRFGFIDEERDWSLDGVPQRQERERTLPIRVCPKCYAMHRPMPVCPKCGHIYVAAGRKVQQLDGELERISGPEEIAAAMAETQMQARYRILINIGKNRSMENPERWATKVMLGEYARRLAKEGRQADGYMVDGLTLEERDRFIAMLRGTENQVEMVV